MKKKPKLLKILLLILFFPIGLIAFVLFGMILLLMYTLGYIPIIGVYITVVLMMLLVPLYPIVMIYGANIVMFGEEQIKIIEDGFLIVKGKKTRRIKWDEIDTVKKVFIPPAYSHEILLTNGKLVKFNVFTELEELIKEMREKDIQFNYKTHEEK